MSLTSSNCSELVFASHFDSSKPNRSVRQETQSFQDRLKVTCGILILSSSWRKSFSCSGGETMPCAGAAQSGSEQQKGKNIKHTQEKLHCFSQQHIHGPRVSWNPWKKPKETGKLHRMMWNPDSAKDKINSSKQAQNLSLQEMPGKILPSQPQKF